MKQRTSWDPAGVTAHRHAAHRHKKEENDPKSIKSLSTRIFIDFYFVTFQSLHDGEVGGLEGPSGPVGLCGEGSRG